MSIGSSTKVNKQESPRLRTARHRSWFLGARKGERGTARYHTKTHLAPPLQTTQDRHLLAKKWRIDEQHRKCNTHGPIFHNTLKKEMPPSTKKQRLLSAAPRRRSQRVASRPDASFDDLSNEVLPNILGFLDLRDIMSARTCCKTMRDATKKAIVGPYTYFCIDSVDKYRGMVAMTEWLPNLPRICLYDLGRGHK